MESRVRADFRADIRAVFDYIELGPWHFLIWESFNNKHASSEYVDSFICSHQNKFVGGRAAQYLFGLNVKLVLE